MTGRFRHAAAAAALVLGLAAGDAHAEWWDKFYFRLGGLYVAPAPSSGPVVLSGVSGTARLALDNGPIAGSGVGMGTALLPAVTLGYRFWDQFTVETILAPPFTLKLTATGTLASQSLSPYALGNLPTKVPPLGAELGETKVLPPIVTVTYRFLPDLPVHPYAGLGLNYLYSYDTHITNPVMTEVHPVTVQLPAKVGFVVQAGLDVRVWRQLFVTIDGKYVAGLSMDVNMNNLDVRVPGLPLYGQVHVGNTSVSVTVNPFIFQAGAGWNF